MFSGIIEERGKVKGISKASQGWKLTVASEIASKDARIGESISVNGVCLTVVGIDGKNISFDIMEETLRRTALSELSAGKIINLERSLKAGDRISGHFVTGHVDCVGKVRSIERRPNEHTMEVEFPSDKKTYVAVKGSVALDGVSLTAAEVKANRLRVYLIPLTLKATNLGSRKAGDSINIEFDILSKYIPQASPSKESKITSEFLREHGFA